MSRLTLAAIVILTGSLAATIVALLAFAAGV